MVSSSEAKTENYPGVDFGWPDSEYGWAKELFRTRNSPEFNSVKSNSPFAEKIVIAVRYEPFARYWCDIDSFLTKRGIEIDIASSIIKNAIRERGMVVHGRDDYVVIFDDLNVISKIFHIRS
ncbi:MAG: hypothetical protein Q7K44_02350 [Candidatus Liptonbacteria bacterium]|nr:hypothetical protein [Candidatus Liptonbacteria bacterium]